MARRDYDNSFRSEQAELTRTRLLDAARDLLATTTPGEAPLTMAAVADKAGVSEPTAYRHFPSRDALMASVAERFARELGEPPLPDSAEELPAHVMLVTDYFGRNANWMRAALKNPHTHEVRAQGRKHREASLRRLLVAKLAHLEPRERELVDAMVMYLVRLDLWDFATGQRGLTDEEAGRALGWTLQALLEALDRDRRARKSHLEVPGASPRQDEASTSKQNGSRGGKRSAPKASQGRRSR